MIFGSIIPALLLPLTTRRHSGSFTPYRHDPFLREAHGLACLPRSSSNGLVRSARASREWRSLFFLSQTDAVSCVTWTRHPSAGSSVLTARAEIEEETAR